MCARCSPRKLAEVEPRAPVGRVTLLVLLGAFAACGDSRLS